MSISTPEKRRLKRRRRVRAKVTGTAERPRISVRRSNRGIFAQLVDDASGDRAPDLALSREERGANPAQRRCCRGPGAVRRG